MKLEVILKPGVRVALFAVAMTCGACQPKTIEVVPARETPLARACAVVNGNVARIAGTLRATGPVDARVVDADGRTRTFSLDGTLFYLAPHFVRFDLKKLGATQVRVGSNATRFWYYAKDTDRYECGWHGRHRVRGWDLPIMPEELVEAFGLTPIPTGLIVPGEVTRLQRIERDYQQVLFLHESAGRGIRIAKEYWLDRYPPHLTRRVVFRNEIGGVDMLSNLGDYRRLGAGGPLLPHRLDVEWFDPPLKLRFKVRRWKSVPQVVEDGIQFRTPGECANP
ncbi:MAG: hypothetical protein ACE5E5_00205 [Phycisphaerae bacterium]